MRYFDIVTTTIRIGCNRDLLKRRCRNFIALIMTVSISAHGSKSLAGSPAPVQTVVAGNTAFALELYQREKASGPNLFFSPCSISTALAMTWCGARGVTAQEMARTLHFSVAPPALSGAFAQLADRFAQIKSETNISLSIANSLWHEREYRFL